MSLKGAISDVLNPLFFFFFGTNVKVGEQFSSQINVADLVGRVNVVDLAGFALVEDGVESISSVGGEEVAAGVETRAVEDERQG